ncbi:MULTISPECIES: esterase-like activity of phytase family protein [unclassified Modestobacter]|uniref:esterase-like activity of phytase family protein n=1 Tax=unclassified Modestobacter TaxID=2643866 RepID=UPI0022AA6BA2|nr:MULTISPECIES: esterase-like activity of phytase family protein [unclassified Modestobacter]MCZ2826324.1 esterase-like activity of phytase family protein [Modestobacter sp. VKM Ac-2981]MCZ2852611.1 esterase-like activity of phytase family protein [Modestobacter sp. VKM Ac-2982]
MTVTAAGLLAAVAVPALAGPAPTVPQGNGTQQAELVGRSVLPSATFGEQVPSGALAAPANGVTPPFAAQPIQGFSGLLADGDDWLVLEDNGYGTKANSGDFLLRVIRVHIDTTTQQTTVLEGGFSLSDPDRKLPFPLTRSDRRLTGADLDPESFQRMPDGTFWIGEEFGPSLVHVDGQGRVLSAPVQPDGVRAPEAWDLGGAAPTLGGSKGFEGMALGVDGHTLYPMLEGAVAGDDPATRRIYGFDTRRGAFTGLKAKVRFEVPGDALGDMVALDQNRFLILERDNAQGPASQLKAVYLIDTRDKDRDGYADKRLLVNLMAMPDPQGVAGPAGGFATFPFVTIEQIAVLDDHHIVVGNDNNYPGSAGRTAGVPDDNEHVVIRVDEDLQVDPALASITARGGRR